MRDPLLDNAKGALIILVVFGHYLEAINGWGNRYFGLTLSAIYIFHMPAFVFLAGITAKREGLWSRVLNIFIVLIIFQLAYVLPLSIIKGGLVVGMLQPYWILWFLLSLTFWMLLIPLIMNVPYAFAISIAVAIIGGFYPADGYQLSIMRTLTFLPFFVGGALYGRRVIAVSQNFSTRWYLAVAVVGTAAVIFKLTGLQHRWLYGSFTYSRLGFENSYGTLIRAALMVSSSACLVAFFSCIPTTRGFLTVIGQRSLAIFTFHGFFVLITKDLMTSLKPIPLYWEVIVIVMASIVTTAILALPVFSNTIRVLAGGISGRLSNSSNF